MACALLSRLRPLSFALAVCLAGCAPGANLPLTPDYKESHYQLGSGDEVRLVVFGEDQITGEYRLDEQEEIAIPLLGQINASGLTTQQLQQRLVEQFKQRKLLTDPSVSIQIVAYRPIYVIGEVARPGQYPYKPGMTMLTAVAVAGGFTYRAVQDYAAALRTSKAKDVTEGRIMPRSLLAPGDVVQVFQRHF